MGRTFAKRGLIVSCQALSNEPLHGGDTMAKMAIAARMAGAVGIRANGTDDIEKIKEAVELPIIGLIKNHIPNSDIFITPTLNDVQAIVETGADIVALDVTDREARLEHVAELIDYVHEMGACVMADISTLAEGIAAEALGADMISTTLSGYTPYSPQQENPDLTLVRELKRQIRVPVIAEGRIWSPHQAREAMKAGADYVVVGSAITRPQLIAARYVADLDEFLGMEG